MMTSVDGPAVSIIIPTFNRAALVSRAIGSALAAAGPGDEVLVADDGSTDETAAVVEGFGAPVRHLALPHAGAGAARNAGIAAATKPLVAFLDSDDEWFADKLALQRGLLAARPDIVYCCSDFGLRLEDGTERSGGIRHWLSPPRSLAETFTSPVAYSSLATLPEGRADFPVYVGSHYREEMHNNFIAAFTLTLRREAARSIRFAEDLPTCEEWPAFGQLTRLGSGAVLSTETAWQHGHAGPRLTKQSMDIWAEAWLATLERVWGSDSEFLATHGDEYRATVVEAKLLRATVRARRGDAREAALALGLAVAHPRALRKFWRRASALRDFPA